MERTNSDGQMTKQETQLSLTNRRDAFIGQSTTPNINGGYSFLLCNSNFVFNTRRFLRYST